MVLIKLYSKFILQENKQITKKYVWIKFKQRYTSIYEH